MCNRIDRLIEQIKNAKDRCAEEDEEITIIIGNDVYPGNVCNIPCKDMSMYSGFNEVAFLTDSKTLDLVSIVGILLGSIDDAVQLISRIVDKKETTMEEFALYLASKNILLVNRCKNNSALVTILDRYKNHKVIVVGVDNLTSFTKKIIKGLCLPHCGSQAYGTHAVECYLSYFEHSFSGILDKGVPNNLSLSDFSLL